jgi:serine/threonine protein kinase
MIGTTLDHFKIKSLLGKGGMGAVYRAEDTRLGREVAIKVLPEEFTSDPVRLARFEREAQVVASLNHPNICALYDVGHTNEIHYLVMELVAGESLDKRIARGLAPDEAIDFATQIALALEAAHANSIDHRDLKPANVILNADGTIKVLDFGLAKAWAGPSEASPNLMDSPTLTHQMTQAGMIMGTAGYMSPEQARPQ